MNKTYFIPIILEPEVSNDEYIEVNVQVVKKKKDNFYFSQIMTCGTEKLLTIEEINDYYGTDSDV